MVAFYADDLAYIHATGFTELSEHAGRQVLAALHAVGTSSGLIVDLGCGSGFWAAMACSAGFQVLGIDVSEAMLRLARSAAPRGNFVRASLYEVDLPRCAAVTAFGEALNYGTPDLPDTARLQLLFRRIFSGLSAGGMFVFDLLVSSDDEPPFSYRTWNATPQYAVLVEAREDTQEFILRRDIVVFRKAGESFHRSDECHRLRVFHAPVVQSLLSSAGFTTDRRTHYGQWRLAARRTAFFARKPC